MLHDSPLRALHESYVRAASNLPQRELTMAQRPGAAVGQHLDAEVEYIPYGPPDQHGAARCEIVASFGDVEREYAAIRRGAGLLDSPHRGTILVTGSAADRRDFLNRMVTQELEDLAPGMAKQAFWLNRKGRIEADLLLIELGDRMVIDVDVHQAAHAVATLREYVFAEQLEIADVSSQYHHIALHGRNAAEVLAACGLARSEMQPLRAAQVSLDSVDTIIARRDQTGQTGYEFIVPFKSAASVWERILDFEERQNAVNRLRPIGWYGYNIARIEDGTPLFNIDFGVTNLPHETGLLQQRVSFTKGC